MISAFELLASVLLVAAANAAPVDEAPNLRVHLDHMSASSIKQFTEARREWVEFLASRKLADPWGGTVLELEGHGVYTLRGFTKLAELDDAKYDTPKDAAYATAVKRYNTRSDAVLKFPHGNQIWQREAELAYLPKKPTSLAGACHGTIDFESVEPLKLEGYASAWEALHEALRKIDYPMTHIVLRDRFGDGRIISIWVTDDVKAPAFDVALAATLGKAEAAKLMAAHDGATRGHETFPLRCRPELSN